MVSYEQRFFGEITIPVDLREFPFDRQKLPITIMARGFSSKEILFVLDDDKTGQAESFTIGDWAVDEGVAEFTDFYL